MHAVQVSHLAKSFGKTQAVAGISFTINQYADFKTLAVIRSFLVKQLINRGSQHDFLSILLKLGLKIALVFGFGGLGNMG